MSSTTGPRSDPTPPVGSCCDAPFIAVLVDKLGKPIKVGKKSQAIPTRVKRAVRARDRGCRVPGMWAATVHRRASHPLAFPWGNHWLANLAELRRHHHWLVHEGGWGLVAEPDGELVAIQPNGEPLALRSVAIDPGGRWHRSPQHQDGRRHRGLIRCHPAAGTATPSTSTTSPPACVQQWEWEHPEAEPDSEVEPDS